MGSFECIPGAGAKGENSFNWMNSLMITTADLNILNQDGAQYLAYWQHMDASIVTYLIYYL